MADSNLVQQALDRGYSIDEIADKLSVNAGIDPLDIRERGYSSDDILSKFGYAAPAAAPKSILARAKKAVGWNTGRDFKAPEGVTDNTFTAGMPEEDTSRRDSWISAEAARLAEDNPGANPDTLEALAASRYSDTPRQATTADRVKQYVDKGSAPQDAKRHAAFDARLEGKINQKYQKAAADADGERIGVGYNPISASEATKADDEEQAGAREQLRLQAIAEDMNPVLRGLGKGFSQSVGFTGALAGYLGDAFDDNELQSYGMGVYDSAMAKAQALTRSPEFTKIKTMDDALSWLTENGGYTAYQAAEGLLSGGVGAAIGKKVGREALVAGAVMGANNLRQTLGSVYGDAVEEAKRTGQPMPSLAQVLAGAVVSAAVDTVADKVGLNAVTAKGFSGGLGSRMAKSIGTQVAVQGGTEGVQLIPEDLGAGKDPFRAGFGERFINEAAVGALGGAGPGLVGGIAKAATPQDIFAQELAANVENTNFTAGGSDEAARNAMLGVTPPTLDRIVPPTPTDVLAAPDVDTAINTAVASVATQGSSIADEILAMESANVANLDVPSDAGQGALGVGGLGDPLDLQGVDGGRGVNAATLASGDGAATLVGDASVGTDPVITEASDVAGNVSTDGRGPDQAGLPELRDALRPLAEAYPDVAFARHEPGSLPARAGEAPAVTAARRQEAQLYTELFALSGLQVHHVTTADGQEKFHGAFIPGNGGHIYLDVNNPHAGAVALRVRAAHEALHDLRERDPEAYDGIATALRELGAAGLSRSEFQPLYDPAARRVKGKQEGAWLGNDDHATEEQVGNLMGNVLADPANIQVMMDRIAGKDPSLVKTFVAAMRRAIETIRKHLKQLGGEYRTEKYQGDIDKVQKLLMDSYVAFAKKHGRSRIQAEIDMVREVKQTPAHKMTITREERELADKTKLTRDELSRVTASAKQFGLAPRTVETEVRRIKARFPESAGWAPLTFLRVDPKTMSNKATEKTPLPADAIFFEPYSYQFHLGDKATHDKRVKAIASDLAGEISGKYMAFKQGDPTAKVIMRQADWYQSLRGKLRATFGGFGDFLAQLLGPTSANNPVEPNFKYGAEALKLATSGKWDNLFKEIFTWKAEMEAAAKALDETIEKIRAEGNKGVMKDPRVLAAQNALKKASQYKGSIPIRENGKQFGMATTGIEQILAETWGDKVRGDAPKTKNYYQNIMGRTFGATIDVWAARTLRRIANDVLGGLPRIPPVAETAVAGKVLADGVTSGSEFGFGQEVFQQAADDLRASGIEQFKNVTPDAVQAMVWFIEKETWATRNWTTKIGEEGSIEHEMLIAGYPDRAQVDAWRVAARAGRPNPEAKAFAGKPEKLEKAVAQWEQAKAIAAAELAKIERYPDRFVAGVTTEIPSGKPTDAEMADTGRELEAAAADDKVMAIRAITSTGEFMGDFERTLDVEVVARNGYDATPLWNKLVEIGDREGQQATFLSRVLREDETADPLTHRPGVELYFAKPKTLAEIQPLMDMINEAGVHGMTMATEGRRTPDALAGKDQPITGIRMQHIPEFMLGFGYNVSVSDAEIASAVAEAKDRMVDLVETLDKRVDVATATIHWYETRVHFYGNNSRIAGGESGQGDGAAWSGQRISEALEGADRFARDGAAPLAARRAELRDLPRGRVDKARLSPVVRSGTRDEGSPGSTGAPGYGTGQPGSVSLTGVHYSKAERSSLAGHYYGQGMKGGEGKRLQRESASPEQLRRVHFYVDEGSGIRPETDVGGHAHRTQLGNLYNWVEDPLNLWPEARAAYLDPADHYNKMEQLIMERGFDGLYGPGAQGHQGVAVLLGKKHVAVPVAYAGLGYRGGDVVTQAKQEAKPATPVTDRVAADRKLPAGRQTGAEWKQQIPEATMLEDGKAYYKDDVVSQLRRAKLSPVTKEEQGKAVRALWLKAAENEDVFQFPKSDAATMGGVFKDINPAFRVSERFADGDRLDKRWVIFLPNKKDVEVKLQKNGRMYVDASQLKSGASFGSTIYAGLLNYAHNNGFVFVGDPAGVSGIATFRRTENMLSAALKFGTTDFMEPSYSQKNPKELAKTFVGGAHIMAQLSPMDWEPGNEVKNLAELMRVSYTNIKHFVPEIENVYYDFSAEDFKWEHSDRVVTGEEWGRLSQQLRDGLVRVRDPGALLDPMAARISGEAERSATLKRVAISNAVLREESSEGVRSVLDRASRELHGAVPQHVKRVLYSPVQEDTAAFKEWFGDSNLRNEDGSPMVLYHGTDQDFSVFKPSKTGVTGAGVYLGDSPDVAESYGNTVMPVYARGRYIGLTAWSKYVQDAGGDWAAARTQAEADGVDGVWDQKIESAVNVWNPANIKSATGNNGDFDPANPDIRYSPVTRFYSQLTRSFEQAPDKVFGSGNQVALWLKSNAGKLGVKQDEIQWSGITDWLDLQGKQKVSKADALGYLAQNGVQVEEVEKGGQLEGEALDKALRSADLLGFDTLRQARAAYREAPQNYDLSDAETGDSTKYHSYTLPGGENYRELLLTLPNEASDDMFRAIQARLDNATTREERVAAIAERTELMEKREKGYSSSHWGERNILAHVRFNDRTDADGDKVLFIEELQSDWGQEGKKKGFGDFQGYRVVEPSGQLFGEYSSKANAEDALSRAKAGSIVERSDQTYKGLPAAPFVADTKSWLSLGLKRMIAYAVENGYDKVAFVNGEQSAERYDLSKQVDVIYAGMAADGKYLVGADKGNARDIISKKVSKEELPDLVGKELAEKIINDVTDEDTNAEYRGVDLSVGGSGMKTFYDRIVPQTINDVLKKLGGGKVETVSLPDAEEQIGFTITPELAAKVSQGMPLFSPRNINGQPIQPTWQATEVSTFDDIARALQDKMIDAKRVLSTIREAGQQVETRFDPYSQEILFHGRSAKKVQDFADGELKPLLNALRMSGITLPQFETWLWANHAVERNAQIAQINPAMLDGGSGLTNAEARALLAGQTVTKNGKTLEAKTTPELTRRARAISDATLDTLVAYGLETQETVNLWRKTYPNYVPLMRDMESDDNFLGAFSLGTGQGFSVRGSASRRAMGSERDVIDILANLSMQRERAITRGEKNRVAMATYGLALKSPNLGFWLPINPDAPKQKLADTVAELIAMGLSPREAESIALEPKEQYLDPQTGLVTERINPALRKREDVMAVRVNGKDRFLFFSNDERAQRMVRGLKNLDMDDMHTVISWVAPFTRWFAAVNTQYNPVFGLVNGIRDFQSAMLNLASTPLAGQEAKVAKYGAKALASIYRDLRAHRKGTVATTPWAQEFEELGDMGGMTGYKDSYHNSQDRTDALVKTLKELSLGKAKKWAVISEANPIFAWLADYNTAIENAFRVAVYKAAKEHGIAKEDAAVLAKGITVNFNKKGTVGANMGALFAFFNAAVQGTARIGETMFEHKGDPSSAGNLRLTKRGKQVIVGGMLLGVLQALLAAAAGYDDGEPPQFAREKNFIIPTFVSDKFISIPMPLGFHVLPNIGRILTEFMLAGGKEPGQYLTRLLGLVTDAFNPLGSSSNPLQVVLPTVLDPAVALATNQDWNGRQIYKDDFNRLHPTPGWTRAKDSATPFAKGLSYGINWATGAFGPYERGLASPTPDQIDYLIGQVTGGVGRELSKASQFGESAVTGESVPLHKVPVVGRFVGETKGVSSEVSRLYRNLEKIGAHHDPLKRLAEEDVDTKAYLAEHPEAKLTEAADQAQRRIAGIDKARREAIKRGDKEMVKRLEQQKRESAMLFNQRVAGAG